MVSAVTVDRGGEGRRLPAGRGLAVKVACARRVPPVVHTDADVGAGVGRRLVEAHAGDGAGHVGAELDPELDRVAVAGVAVAGAVKSKMVARGVTAFDGCDDAPLPTAFVALTRNV